MDLLSASMHDSGILKTNGEDWIMDNETDELLNSILTGSDGSEALPLFDHVDDDLGYQTQFDQELLSPAGSTGSSHNPANNIDLVDIFANDLQPEDGGTLQGVNPHTNSPDPDPQKLHDDHDTDTSEDMTVVEPKQNKKPKGPKVQVQQPRARKVATRISSTNVYHHSGIKPTTNAAGTISIVRPNAINATPITLANGGTFDTGTTTILLPVLNSKSGSSQPTIIRMNPTTSSVGLKRRRMSGSSSDSDGDLQTTTITENKSKYPRLDLNDEEKRLCEKEGIVLPSHYPLTKEEERNLKRIRRKIRNKLSAQDSRKRKKEYVDSMEAKAMKCAAENAELVKKLSMLETQNKTLVGQLRRLHQIIVNRGGIKSANAIAQAAMGKDNKPSTALMMLFLTTALFLIPGMKDQFNNNTEKDMVPSPAHPPMPGQSRSLLHFKEEEKFYFGDHDYVAPVPEKTNKKSYIVADVPPLGYGGDKGVLSGMRGSPGALDGFVDHEVVVVTTDPDPVKQEHEEDGERRLSVNVTGGESGKTRTVVLHVPRDI